MANGRETFVGSLAVVLLSVAALSGCAKEKCEACAGDSDCGSEMVCHPDLKICTMKGDKPSCPAQCEKSEKCAQYAMCTLKADKCVIGELDCSKSAQCSDEGKCTRKDLGDYGTCITINDTDCSKSAFCAAKGHCSVDRKSRQCRAMSDSDCEVSEMCTKHKKCMADTKTGECIAAPKPAEPAASAAPAD